MTSRTKVVASGTDIAIGTTGVPARFALGTFIGARRDAAAALAIKLLMIELSTEAPAATTGHGEFIKIGKI